MLWHMHDFLKIRTLYTLFCEKIDSQLPANLAQADRERLRREKYTMRTKEAFLALPKDERPLYAILDRIIKTNAIRENGEPFVDLYPLVKKHKSQIVFAPGSTAYGAIEKAMRLRKSVAERLFKAEKILQKFHGKNFTFKITDTFRPISLQRIYFERAKQEVIQREGLSGEALYERVTHLIADPETCPPHSTGGAIDLTIIDLSTGKELEMGTAVDAMEIDMIYMWNPEISDAAKDNRVLLYTVMLSAGFVNMPIEWWHYSYGDQEWALLTGAPAALYDSCSGSPKHGMG